MTNNKIDDVVLNKIAVIERCLGRVDEEYLGSRKNLKIITRSKTA